MSTTSAPNTHKPEASQAQKLLAAGRGGLGTQRKATQSLCPAGRDSSFIPTHSVLVSIEKGYLQRTVLSAAVLELTEFQTSAK